MENTIEEKTEKKITEMENIAIKRWFVDNNRSKVNILTGNYLDSYELNEYNELKIKLACLRGRGQES